jgi:electron transfer flavoprotein alpha/beta subunit
MGRQTFPGESGQTPFLVAARCALPCVADVMDVSCVERGVSVRSRTDAGECSRVVTRPAVFVMGEAAHPYLRAATLREKLRARGRAEETCLSEPFSPVMGAGKRLRYLYEPREKHCHFIESGTMEAKTGVMWERYLREAALHENC